MGCPWLSVRRSTVSERQPNQKTHAAWETLGKNGQYCIFSFFGGITCCRYFQVQWNLKLVHKKHLKELGIMGKVAPDFLPKNQNQVAPQVWSRPQMGGFSDPDGGRGNPRGPGRVGGTSVMWGGGPSPETKRKVPKNGWFPIGISWISRGKPPFSGAFCCYFQGGGILHLL